MIQSRFIKMLLFFIPLAISACGGGGSNNGGSSNNSSAATVDPLYLEDVPVLAPKMEEKPLIEDWLKTVDGFSTTYNFFLYLPETYPETTEKKYPVVIFLHGDNGSTARFPNLTRDVLVDGPLSPLLDSTKNIDPNNRILLNDRVRDAIVINPQIPHIDRDFVYDEPLGYWNGLALNNIVDWVTSKYRVDQSRIYVTGLSMGGGGTFHYAAAFPYRIAAIVPICNGLGSGKITGALSLRNKPIWMFHNYDDPVVSLQNEILPTANALMGKDANIWDSFPQKNATPFNTYTISYDSNAGLSPWIQDFNAPQGKVNLTIFPSGGHNAWDQTYTSDAMWDWLFSQSL